MKLLVTGASGLLGSRLVKVAAEAGHTVRPTYHTGPIIPHNAELLDITNESAVERTLNHDPPDAVIHTASLTDVDFCERNSGQARLVNGMATRFIANACRKLRVFLIYISTDYVFDGQRGMYKEEDSPNPINVYGSSKLLGEQDAANALSDLCIVRTSVLYGWGRPSRNNFATWLYENLSEGRRVDVVTDQHASPTLNSSLARMVLEIAERHMVGTYHLAGATRLSRYDFAVELASQLRLSEDLLTSSSATRTNWLAKRPPDSSLDVQQASRTLRNKPIRIKEALVEFAHESSLAQT